MALRRLRRKRPGCRRGHWRVPGSRRTRSQSKARKYAYDPPLAKISTAMTDPLALNLFQPICPDRCEADGENCNYRRHDHYDPELEPSALHGLEFIRVVHEESRIVVGEVICAEDAISRQRRHQEAGERPLDRNETYQEHDAS